MTVCPAFGVGYKESVLNKYGSTASTYRRGNYSTPNEPLANPRDVFRRATYDLPEILHSLHVETLQESMRVVHLPVQLGRGPYSKWTVRHNSLYGLCYSLDIDSALTKFIISEVVIQCKVDIFVYLHHPGQYMDVTSKTKLPGQVGELLFIDIAYEIREDTLGEKALVPCQKELDFRLDDCVDNGVGDDLMSHFNCSVPYTPGATNDVCPPTDNELMRKAFARYDYLTSIGQRELCGTPCTSMDVITGH